MAKEKKASKKKESKEKTVVETAEDSLIDTPKKEKKEKKEKEKEKKEKEKSKKRKSEDDGEKEDVKKAKVEVKEVKEVKEPAKVWTVWCGGFDRSLEKEVVEDFFSSCGEIVGIRMKIVRKTKMNPGFAYIDFASEEGQKAALALSDTKFKNNVIRCDAVDPTEPRIRKVKASESPQAKKVFVGNLNIDVDGKTYGESMRKAFSKYGTIVGDIKFPMADDGKNRGFCYIEFASTAEAAKAIEEMNGVEIEGRPIRTSHVTSPGIKTSAPFRLGEENNTDYGNDRRGNRGRGGFSSRGDRGRGSFSNRARGRGGFSSRGDRGGFESRGDRGGRGGRGGSRGGRGRNF